jgi:hypothetical protein
MNRTITATMGLWLIASPAYACETSPGHDGTYWRYWVDHATGRHCWYSAAGHARRHHRRDRDQADAQPAPPKPSLLPGPFEPVPYPPPDNRFGVWPDPPDSFESRWSAIVDPTR